MKEDLDLKEEKLQKKLKKIESLEKDIEAREKKIRESEKSKKQILLRISSSLWEDIAAWAEDDFRSINGQIEYLLAECVREHKNIK